MLNRRGFLGALGAALAMPAVITRPGILMPVRKIIVPEPLSPDNRIFFDDTMLAQMAVANRANNNLCVSAFVKHPESKAWDRVEKVMSLEELARDGFSIGRATSFFQVQVEQPAVATQYIGTSAINAEPARTNLLTAPAMNAATWKAKA